MEESLLFMVKTMILLVVISQCIAVSHASFSLKERNHPKSSSSSNDESATNDFSSHFWCSKLYNPLYPLNPTNITLPLSNITAYNAANYPPPPFTVTPLYNPYLTNEPQTSLLLYINKTIVGSGSVQFLTQLIQFGGESTTLQNVTINLQQQEGEKSRYEVPLDLTSLQVGINNIEAMLLTSTETYKTNLTLITAESPEDPTTYIQINYKSMGVTWNGAPWFPMGYYYNFGEQFDLTMMKEARNQFQSFIPYYDIPITSQYNDSLNLAARIGSKFQLDLHTVAQSPSSPSKFAMLEDAVKQVMYNPALLAYYIADEPDGHGFGLDPAILQEVYDFIKEIDPYHPITIVLNCVSSAPRYVNTADIIMADPYCIDVSQPVGCDFCTGQPYDVATRIDEVLTEINNTKPLWIVLQAFGSESEHWPRLPSPQEERTMTYLSLIHGAKGILYFLEGVPFSQSLWGECQQLALEVFELSAAILSEDEKIEVIVNEGANVINATTFVERDRNVITLLIVNPINEPIAFSISLPLLSTISTLQIEVVFENRIKLLNAGNFSDFIDGFGSRVYRIFTDLDQLISSPSLSSSPSSLLLENGRNYKNVGIDSRNMLINPSFEDQHNAGMADGFNFNNIFHPTQLNNLIADPRYSVHGYHSIRMINTLENSFFNISCYPVVLAAGENFQFSVWARSTSSVDLLIGSACLPGVNLIRSLEGNGEWTELVYPVFSLEVSTRCYFTLFFDVEATIWIDLWQLIHL